MITESRNQQRNDLWYDSLTTLTIKSNWRHPRKNSKIQVESASAGENPPPQLDEKMWKSVASAEECLNINRHSLSRGKPPTSAWWPAGVHMKDSAMPNFIRRFQHKYMHTWARTYIDTYIHTYWFKPTYIHTYIHRYIHTDRHTYIPMDPDIPTVPQGPGFPNQPT